MARIDLLTAQMRQRAIQRVSIQSDEKMKLFDASDQQIGAGAALAGDTIRELLGEIAPSPLDGVPTTFSYYGPDGQFEIAVASGAASFEMRVLSFASAPTEPTQAQNAAPTPVAPPAIAPASDAPRWFYIVGEQQIGPHTNAQIKSLIRSGTLRRDAYLWHEGLAEWQMAAYSEFKALFPALPTLADPNDDSWFYRSPTGQPVPVERAVLVEKIRSGALTSDTWVWHGGMNDWASASQSELASSLAAPKPLQGGLAPIAAPTGGGPRALPGSGPHNVYGGGDPDNTSGGGTGVEVPKRARGWFNVGAFLFPVFWCYTMGMPSIGTGILVYSIATRQVDISYLWVPELLFYLGLGIMGNRLAWQHRRFDSIEDFRKCQLIWGIASVSVWVIILTALFFLFRNIIRLVLGF